MPSDFEVKQFYDENYKMNNGESQKDVRERMDKALFNILEQYKSKKIIIVSHATAMMFLFKKGCEINFDGETYKMNFKDKMIFNNCFNAPEIFKLTFDDNNDLVSIENIRPIELG